LEQDAAVVLGPHDVAEEFAGAIYLLFPELRKAKMKRLM
jgi:hypothetical protein